MRSMATIELPVRQRGTCCELEVPADRDWAAGHARLLKALADPTRLAMVWCLRRADGPVCICDFTATFDLGQPTISHHMGKLRAAGLVESEKRGLWVYYRLRGDLAPATARLIEVLVTAPPPPGP
ncbi:MAG: helix-turn-helix transcriptional regulator [Chloroflexi bacterium]|jgi:ArsR family transcriptional regulator, arsenate/arsenite/antimonite-responsive transcriptional repressor|nr:MAG: helix-turn-helix transcriptional regulator [Chloroflexota bacterium]